MLETGGPLSKRWFVEASIIGWPPLNEKHGGSWRREPASPCDRLRFLFTSHWLTGIRCIQALHAPALDMLRDRRVHQR